MGVIFLRNATFTIVFALLLTFSSLFGVSSATSLGQSEVGVRAAYRTLKCGHGGVRKQQRVIQVIVVGRCGACCTIRITEKLLGISDLSSGYVCIAAESAKAAYVVREDDARVTGVTGYKDSIKIANEVAKFQGFAVEVIFINAGGPSRREKRCKYDLF